MSQKKRGLGRGLGDLGLNELLSVNTEATALVETQAALEKQGQLRQLPVDVIKPGRYQPRKQMSQEALEELAASIRAQGIIQPILVRRLPSSSDYELIAGERRWRAAQLAGLHEVPAVIREIPDEDAIAMSLIENIQRRDLNAIEEAMALQRLIMEFQMTHQEVADAVGKSRTMVTNLLRLLKLNPDVRALVEQGFLEMGHARALLALEAVQQSDMAEQVVKQGLSVRETEQRIRKHQQHGQLKTKSEPKKDPNISRLQSDLSDKLGAIVAIQHRAAGKGKLIIHYNNVDELDGILDHIQ